jgi:hypothetical protein
MDSLKFHLGPPCPTLLRPAGGPTLKRRNGRFRSGPRPSSTPLDTRRRSPLVSCHSHSLVKSRPLLGRLEPRATSSAKDTNTKTLSTISCLCPRMKNSFALIFIVLIIMIIVGVQLIQLLCGLVTKNLEPENSWF